MVAETMMCPHCNAQNPAGGQFCESCGKALPTLNPTGPRIISKTEFATTSAGQKLQGDELQKTAKKASGALLTAGVIQFAVGAIVFFSARYTRPILAQGSLLFLFITFFGLGAIFIGLAVWARKQPLPAAIVGLALYGTLTVLGYILLFSAAAKMNTTPRIGIPWIEILIIGILVQAIQAGQKYRKLQQQQEAGY